MSRFPIAMRNPQDRPVANEISPDRSRAVRHHHERLPRIHSPETLEETQLVEHLAIAQSKLEEAQAAWDERLRWQRLHVEQLYDQGESQHFENGMKAWRTLPHVMLEVFGQSRLSAICFRDLWKWIVDAFVTGISISFEHDKEMIMPLGSDWRVDVAQGRMGRRELPLRSRTYSSIVLEVGRIPKNRRNPGEKGRD